MRRSGREGNLQSYRLLPGNRKTEMAHKIRACIESGAKEVIVVEPDGKVTFYRADGGHPESALGVRLDLPPELSG